MELPAHTPEEIAALEDDIRHNGMRGVVTVDEKGNLIDGRLRRQICERLKVDTSGRRLDWAVGAQVVAGLSEPEKMSLRIRLNLLGRKSPPTPKQRRGYCDLVLIGNPELSDSTIGQLVGLTQQAVNKRRHQLTKSCRLRPVAHTVGRDGKRRSVQRQRARVVVNSKRELGRVQKLIQKLGDEVPTGSPSPKTLVRTLGHKERRERLKGIKLQPLPENCQIYHCDFRNLGIAPNSVDLIFTDVLWHKTAARDWADLGKLAVKWLKPKGLFATFMGQRNLPLFYQTMATVPGLHYQWQFVSTLEQGGHTAHESNGIVGGYRPVIVYGPEPEGQHNFHRVIDVVTSERLEKTFHDYQRTVGEVEGFIEYLSYAGDMVVDPCLGSGTTALACLNAPRGVRRFVGCDLDPKAVRISKARVSDYLKERKRA